MKLKILKAKNTKIIKGPAIITPELFEDKRGYFYELWNQSEFNELIGEKINFIQDNISFSMKGVLRGLHYQLSPNIQSKLITCLKGAIFDVAVDLRRESKTFGLYCCAYLNQENKNQFWIPNGFAHGFLTLVDNTKVHYKVKGLRDIKSERVIKWDDPNIAINWPILENNIDKIILSNKDEIAPNFDYVIKSEDYFI